MINETLKLLRLFNNYTTAKLSDEIGLSQSYISEIEHGKKVPNLHTINLYAEVFNIKPSTILLFSEALDKESIKDVHGSKQYVAYAGAKLLKIIDSVGRIDEE